MSTESRTDEMETLIQKRIATRIVEVDLEQNPDDYGPITAEAIRRNAKEAKEDLSAWVRSAMGTL